MLVRKQMLGQCSCSYVYTTTWFGLRIFDQSNSFESLKIKVSIVTSWQKIPRWLWCDLTRRAWILWSRRTVWRVTVGCRGLHTSQCTRFPNLKCSSFLIGSTFGRQVQNADVQLSEACIIASSIYYLTLAMCKLTLLCLWNKSSLMFTS